MTAFSQTVPDLMKQAGTPGFKDSLVKAIGEKKVKDGTGVIGEGPNFIWAVEAATPPQLIVDDELAGVLTRIPDSTIWYHSGQLQTGRTHNFHYIIGGTPFGGAMNVMAFGPESYEKPGVSKGTLSEKLVHTSKIYEGMKSEYWIYVPAQYDPEVPAALMVWQDGEGSSPREVRARKSSSTT